MKSSCCTFKVGTRGSKLGLVQAEGVLAELRRLLPGCGFELLPFSSPGDRDQATDLRAGPADFFTRDLDDALRAGRLDFAVHSAKDLPAPVPEGLDWFWLPWREDPRDVLVLPAGRTMAGLPARPRIGVSSDRRAEWSRARFPGAELPPVRGVIESRLAQLDAGRFDLLVMAAAALNRLGLRERISEWIPQAELAVPDGQGVLAVTFRAGDARMRRLRSLFVRPAVFAGAGAGRAGTCTLEVAEALASAEVCLHDALLDPALLDRLPPGALRLGVGKRCGDGGHDAAAKAGETPALLFAAGTATLPSSPPHRHTATPPHRSCAGQAEINQLLADYARRGLRLVRLKGGDPGVFGRLAEELETLEAHGLPYRVLPGVSSLQCATTGTGMLLTRRGESRGFCVMTPRGAGGEAAPVTAAVRAELPAVFFMGTGVLRELLAGLLADGVAPETPAAAVFDAGSVRESIVRGSCADLAERVPAEFAGRPGLVIVGAPAAHALAGDTGALAGRRVLLTCSAELQPAAARAVLDLGGVPVPCPLVRLVPEPEGVAPLLRGERFGWLVLTSPSAARACLNLLRTGGFDLRRLPKIMVCGPGAARVLEEHGIRPDAVPESGFGAEGLLRLAAGVLNPGERVLRLRSDAAGDGLTAGLEVLGAEVTDAVVCRNEPVRPAELPPFDAVFFASASVVRAYFAIPSAESLAQKDVTVMGGPTLSELAVHGVRHAVAPAESTVASALQALACGIISREQLAGANDFTTK